MNLLIRLPNWLGDAIMASYALEILKQHFKEAHFYLVGSQTSCELYKNFPNATIILDQTKKSSFRLKSLYRLAKEIPPCDIGITFQNNFLSALLLYLNQSKIRIGYAKELRAPLLTHRLWRQRKIHQALRYSRLVELIIKEHQVCAKTYLTPQNMTPKFLHTFEHKKVAGINAGAAFGDAKRWKEEYFADIIESLITKDYSIILFGSKDDAPIVHRIIEQLPNKDLVLNLAGEINIQELIVYIAHLDVFITNDSGPMHIAAALDIPTLALFGPTNQEETCPFNAKYFQIVSLKNLNKPISCAPCKKRSCPLPKQSPNYHACMQQLKPQYVMQALKLLKV